MCPTCPTHETCAYWDVFRVQRANIKLASKRSISAFEGGTEEFEDFEDFEGTLAHTSCRVVSCRVSPQSSEASVPHRCTTPRCSSARSVAIPEDLSVRALAPWPLGPLPLAPWRPWLSWAELVAQGGPQPRILQSCHPKCLGKRHGKDMKHGRSCHKKMNHDEP